MGLGCHCPNIHTIPDPCALDQRRAGFGHVGPAYPRRCVSLFSHTMRCQDIVVYRGTRLSQVPYPCHPCAIPDPGAALKSPSQPHKSSRNKPTVIDPFSYHTPSVPWCRRDSKKRFDQTNYNYETFSKILVYEDGPRTNIIKIIKIFIMTLSQVPYPCHPCAIPDPGAALKSPNQPHKSSRTKPTVIDPFSYHTPSVPWCRRDSKKRFDQTNYNYETFSKILVYEDGPRTNIIKINKIFIMTHNIGIQRNRKEPTIYDDFKLKKKSLVSMV